MGRKRSAILLMVVALTPRLIPPPSTMLPIHISVFDVKAILSPENGKCADIKLLWSTPQVQVGEGQFEWRYHSECIQIKSGGTFYESPVSALQGPLVDNNPVASKWVTISEKSRIQIGGSLWKLEIRPVRLSQIFKHPM